MLGTLCVAGVFAVGAMAPNVAGLLARALPDGRLASQHQSAKRTIGRMIERGYIHKEGGRYRLSEEGSVRLHTLLGKAHANGVRSTKPKKWDGKWRVVVFDVKETRRPVRDELRRTLQETGFIKLQDSVWVYPYRCDEVVMLLKFHLTLGRDLVYMIVDAIEGDDVLRTHFALPKK